MDEKVFNKKKVIITIILIAIILLLLLIPKNVKVSFEDTDFRVSASTYKSTIEYSKITEVKLLDEFEIGTRVFGFGGIVNDIGDYRNNVGKYRLYIHSEIEKYISVNTEDGLVVFNLSSVEKTEEVYNELLSKLALGGKV